MAVQILSRINESTKIHISLNDFFDTATISRLAEKINQQDSCQVGFDSFDNTDAMVDALSDEEVAHLLADKAVAIDE